MGAHAWSRVLAVMSGQLRPWVGSPLAPLGVSRDQPESSSDVELTEEEIEVLSALLKRPLNGDEIAFVLGVDLEITYALIRSLRRRDLILEMRRSWACTAKGRNACLRSEAAAWCLPIPSPPL